jgi:SAM-dependent methyltransferase
VKFSYHTNNLKWALRKARLPVKATDLVLDVGSGSNPHPAADVLLEKYVDDTHRVDSLVADRATVLADACKMPFADKTFDFVIAFHVLEHMREPERFLGELQRVGKAGYIETPNALFERLIPYDIHLLEVMDIDGCLMIHKKSAAKPDAFINNLNLIQASPKWNCLFYTHPHLFHVRYLWNDHICFRIVNPETSCDWFQDPPVEAASTTVGVLANQRRIRDVRSLGLSLLRGWYKLRKHRTFKLEDLLVCPECHNTLEDSAQWLACSKCRVRYPRLPHPDFNRPAKPTPT